MDTYYLKTFTVGVGHMVDDQTYIYIYRERKPTAAIQWGTPFDKQQDIFYMHIVLEHWLD